MWALDSVKISVALSVLLVIVKVLSSYLCYSNLSQMFLCMWNAIANNLWIKITCKAPWHTHVYVQTEIVCECLNLDQGTDLFQWTINSSKTTNLRLIEVKRG